MLCRLTCDLFRKDGVQNFTFFDLLFATHIAKELMRSLLEIRLWCDTCIGSAIGGYWSGTYFTYTRLAYSGLTGIDGGGAEDLSGSLVLVSPPGSNKFLGDNDQKFWTLSISSLDNWQVANGQPIELSYTIHYPSFCCHFSATPPPPPTRDGSQRYCRRIEAQELQWLKGPVQQEAQIREAPGSQTGACSRRKRR